MRDNPSLADQAIFTLGEIERSLDGMEDDDPLEYAARQMKRAAERAVSDGYTQAFEIVNIIRMMRRDSKK